MSLTSQDLFVPTYDDGTKTMARWIRAGHTKNLTLHLGRDATHQAALAVLGNSEVTTKLLIFVGHGTAGGLLTERGIGKASSPICYGVHECLLDTDDLLPTMRDVHIVGWACSAGGHFGQRVAMLNASGYLGFDGPLDIVINHEPSEQHVWSPVLLELVERVCGRGKVESHDAEWLTHQLLDRRKAIKERRIDTGVHNRINSMFLKRAAKRAVVHV